MVGYCSCLLDVIHKCTSIIFTTAAAILFIKLLFHELCAPLIFVRSIFFKLFLVVALNFATSIANFIISLLLIIINLQVLRVVLNFIYNKIKKNIL
jgi:hypothetical protein